MQSSDNGAFALAIVLVPALTMSVGELTTATVSKRVQAASQNLSAGLILGSLSSEIQPLVTSLVIAEQGSMRYQCLAAMMIGGFLSLATNTGISIWADREEDSEDNEEAAVQTQTRSSSSLGVSAQHILGQVRHAGAGASDNERMPLRKVDKTDGGCYSSIGVQEISEEPLVRGPSLLEWEPSDSSAAGVTDYSSITEARARDLVASVSLQACSLPGTIRHRGSFDDVLHGLERDVHELLRCVSKTPNVWGEREQGRVLEHVNELQRAVHILEETFFRTEGVQAAAPLSTPASLRALVESIGGVESALEHLHEHVERSTFRRWGFVMARGHWSLLSQHHRAAKHLHSIDDHITGAAIRQQENFSSATIAAGTSSAPNRSVLVLTVSVDAFVDGFLIGLCIATDFTTAYIMAAATALEMGFLGLAYGAVLRGDMDECNRSVAGGRSMRGWHLSNLDTTTVVRLCLPPLIMVAAGFTGAKLGVLLEGNKLLFLGMLSFASASLVFLVTQELLTEARQNANYASTIDVNGGVALLFVGIFLAFVLGTSND